MIAHLRRRGTVLDPLGWTGRRAEWIALACLHGGIFTRAQWARFLDCHPEKVRRAVHALIAQGVATEENVPGVVFQFVSVDFTKLFHELVRSLFELVHYCRRELRPGKGPVEPYVSVKLATVTLSCSSELIQKIPRPCIGII